MNRLRVYVLLLGILLIAACATVPPSQQEDSVLTVLQMLENRRTDELSRHSRTPFLLDAEIITAEKDVLDLWQLLTTRGYQFPNPVIESITPAAEDSYQLFGDTMEVRVYFERHLPDDAAVAEVTAGGERFRFIFAESINGRSGLPLMYGWKGPL
ncbi:MAG: hypothetical protein ACOC0D_06605 [Spirochaeta sp.]